LIKIKFFAWKFKMTNFLMGKGYWEYIGGDLEEALEVPEKNTAATQIRAHKDWH
jgi:hypothetical protein